MPSVSIEVTGKSLAQAVRDFECALIAQALAEAGGNKTQAARVLGIDREALKRKISSATIRYVAVIE